MPRKAKSRPVDPAERIVRAALDLAAQRPWRQITLADVAQRAKLDLATLYRHVRSKGDLLAAYSRSLDAAVLSQTSAKDAAEPARDRLFDVVMRRFDAMKPDRAALKSIAEDTVRDPWALCAGRGPLLRSMAWMLEAAGIGSGGLKGCLRVRGLALIYLTAARAWLGDDTEDLAPTMAALDRALMRAQPWAELVNRI
jgi:AcrR family transcriptional regulator